VHQKKQILMSEFEKLPPKAQGAVGCISIIIFLITGITLWNACEADDKRNAIEKKPIQIENSPPINVDKHPVMYGNLNAIKLLFNEFSKQIRLKYKIKKFPEAQNGLITYAFSKHLAMMIEINDDQQINSLVMVTDGKEDALTIISAFGEIIYITNPTMLPEERGDILKRVGIIGDNVDLKTINNYTIEDGIKYSAIYSKSIGLCFMVERSSN
jgi:hypothetical protein